MVFHNNSKQIKHAPQFPVQVQKNYENAALSILPEW
jgi:hypothetical protein